MIITKFGGKSLDTIQKVQNVCNYIIARAKTQKIVVVVSAFGEKTDELIKKYHEYGGTSAATAHYDMLLSIGELESAALVTTMLTSMGAKAKAMGAAEANIMAIGNHSSGIITGINKNAIAEALKTHDIVVVAGFQGINSGGEVITLGRNGSDTTAVALASAFNTAVEIYSDFNGIYHGDPRRQNFKKISEISYNDALELAGSGAPVLSASSVSIAEQSATQIIAKASNTPNGFGTFVTNIPKSQITITTKDNLSKITINFNGNNSNMQKTLKYIINNVNFIDFSAKNSKIELIIAQNISKKIEYTLAKLNNLLEQ